MVHGDQTKTAHGHEEADDPPTGSEDVTPGPVSLEGGRRESSKQSGVLETVKLIGLLTDPFDLAH